MKITGHKTESIYRRYAIVDHGVMQEGMAKVARYRRDSAEKRKVVPINGTVAAQSA